ncbi:MAG TPA: DUF1016 family protein [Planctomycetaceae bacterium]|nr:DUF1016 family protein [Planctomycetaceae bacterium]
MVQRETRECRVGFSASNPWRMRGLVEAYGDDGKLAPLVREIGWSHYLVIMARCKDSQEREFYLRMTRKFGWSKSVLTHHGNGNLILTQLVNKN